ncbi:isochorismatase family protein [Xylona heveae TC161]|uniref:nicotinamidase n=1 Tax=Xylona heveae (strain CBS 132557 / TC161) TaxID=1328760 RepID=A0A161TEP0_XYLHT|nr:isochorismatase family protein [Xylona heveae TC161]KZF24417.1 isochorismatase family protein [Xylona heveae TC161]
MSAGSISETFKPALLVIDMQEDFCPPNGSLAVTGGRDIVPVINNLLRLPFILRIATKDFHPADHVSFASNHSAPNNVPFSSVVTIANPSNPDETETTKLWPVHCVQGTPGAELLPELDASRLDRVIEKGTDSRVEMYSAFRTPFRNPAMAGSGLTAVLKENGITHVFVAGLAADYCVCYSALDSAEDGFTTYLLEEGTRAVDPSQDGWGQRRQELESKGVKIVSVDGEEVRRVKNLLA